MFQHTLFCFALISVFTQPFVVAHGSHNHKAHRRYFQDWAHPQDHSVNKLFKRGGDGAQYPDVGSAEWLSKYPPANGQTPDKGLTPKEWIDALNAADGAGKIPKVDLTTIPKDKDGNPMAPAYPNNQDPTGPGICSSTYQCRGAGDIWDGPDGVFGVSFDDGPLTPTSTLVDFLKQNNEIATHFMIGGNIRNNPQQFLEVFNYGGDCAVHTWSHPYMTSLSNEDVVAELGWTMQIIHDSTGGKVPKMWRPPTGDSDIRVRAIAKEVFGLTTVIWNQDSQDWRISQGGQTLDGVNADMDKWLTGSKSPGLIILEHELTNITVQGFMGNYPKIKSNGWNTKSVAQLFGDAYQNTKGDQVTSANVYLPQNGDTSTNTTTSTSSSVSSTTTASRT
ncbi:chitin deacetylase [Marasmius fiardii PR-910]|nr:chitin deacetylase [Marasmius fiardii PR-910]